MSQLPDDAGVSNLSGNPPLETRSPSLHPELPDGARPQGVEEDRVERDDDAKHEPVENKPPARPDLRIL